MRWLGWEELWELRDKRTDGWFMVDSPKVNIFICAVYVLLVTKVGPYYMRDRPAYQFKHLLMAYNLFQVVLSVVSVVHILKVAWLSHYSWVCQPVELGTDPLSSGMIVASYTWTYFILKYVEMADTFFFVARKKFNQVSTLHVYHHAIMPLYSYMLIRWSPGGHESLAGTLNTFVHTWMYGYYFLAAFGPKIQPYLWWKKYLTVLQLAQFIFCFGHSFILVAGIVKCSYPWQVSLLSMVFLHVPFFAMFMRFYLKTYTRSKDGAPDATSNETHHKTQ